MRLFGRIELAYRRTAFFFAGAFRAVTDSAIRMLMTEASDHFNAGVTAVKK